MVRRLLAIIENTVVELFRKPIMFLTLVMTIVMFALAIGFFVSSTGNVMVETVMAMLIPYIPDVSILFPGLVCTFYACQLLNTEIRQKTIFSILVRPVHYEEYVAGKTLGISVFYFFYAVICFFGSLLFSKVADVSLNPGWQLAFLMTVLSTITFFLALVSLGSLFSTASIIFWFFVFFFFSSLLSRLPDGSHWFFTGMAYIFHYITPLDTLSDWSRVTKSYTKPDWVEWLVLLDHVLYGLLIFLGCSWVFRNRDLRVKMD